MVHISRLEKIFCFLFFFFGANHSHMLCSLVHIVCGVGVGISSAIVPMFMTEIVPPQLRGILGIEYSLFFLSAYDGSQWILSIGALLQTSIAFGVTLVSVVGLPTVDSTSYWKDMMYFSIIPAVSRPLAVIAAAFVDSWRWLCICRVYSYVLSSIPSHHFGWHHKVIQRRILQLFVCESCASPAIPTMHVWQFLLSSFHNHIGSALQRIRTRRSPEQIEAELASILRATSKPSGGTVNSDASPSASSWSWIKPLLIGCGAQAFQQLSGINVLHFHTQLLLTDGNASCVTITIPRIILVRQLMYVMVGFVCNRCRI